MRAYKQVMTVYNRNDRNDRNKAGNDSLFLYFCLGIYPYDELQDRLDGIF